MLFTTTSLYGLKFSLISPEKVQVAVYIDAEFSANEDKPSKVEIFVTIRDKLTGTVNVIH